MARALALPDTSEELYPGGASVNREDRWMFSLKKDGEMIVLKLAWDDHDRLLAAHPEAILKTSHYEGYPAFLVRLDALTPTIADELLAASWEDAPNKAKRMPR
ncbi:hypothetical protein EON77_17940 [bacterium]|nr:MAG: hypothetical protein EON77_17940 [bacterium]